MWIVRSVGGTHSRVTERFEERAGMILSEFPFGPSLSEEVGSGTGNEDRTDSFFALVTRIRDFRSGVSFSEEDGS